MVRMSAVYWNNKEERGGGGGGGGQKKESEERGYPKNCSFDSWVKYVKRFDTGLEKR